jgi:hypothetical protein
MSSNPFRSKGSSGGGDLQPDSSARFPSIDAIEPTPPAATPPPRTSFRANAPPEISLKTAKVVKKVRVLSPPPLSPDSPEWPFHAPLPQQPVQEDGGPDPFASADHGDATGNVAPIATPPVPAAAPIVAPSGPPGNPFSKTLQDIEPDEAIKAQEYQMEREEGAVLKAANAAKGAMNVDSFRRLLMTGNTGDSSLDSPATSGTSTPELSAAATKPTSGSEGASLRRTLERDTDSESDSSSDSESSPRDNKETKTSRPPPPPNSRHGKSLKADTRDDALASNATNPPPAAAPSRKSLDEESESAATEAKKPVPAPPPRRGHGRTDTKSNISTSQGTPQPRPRKSSEEGSSPDLVSLQDGGSRQGAPAPAPPPPRRPHLGNRPVSLQPGPSLPASIGSGSNPSPTTPQFDSSAQPSPSETPSQVKTSAPPPPPTRQGTVRRPPSVNGGTDQGPAPQKPEGKQRDGAAASAPPPPPPPPRQRARGSSRSSTEGGVVPRRTSTDSAVKVEQRAANMGIGADILAEIEALQREVDALRGRGQ